MPTTKASRSYHGLLIAAPFVSCRDRAAEVLSAFSKTAESLKVDIWNVRERDPANRFLATQVCNRELILSKGDPVINCFPGVWIVAG